MSLKPSQRAILERRGKCLDKVCSILAHMFVDKDSCMFCEIGNVSIFTHFRFALYDDLYLIVAAENGYYYAFKFDGSLPSMDTLYDTSLPQALEKWSYTKYSSYEALEYHFLWEIASNYVFAAYRDDLIRFVRDHS